MLSEWVMFEQGPADPWERECQQGGTAGTKVEVELVSAFSISASACGTPKLVLSAFVSLLSPVAWFHPHSLRNVHIETHRQHNLDHLPQVSHYIQDVMELEVRIRPAGRSWEVSTWLRPTCPDSSLSWAPCPSFISAKPQKPLINPCCSLNCPPSPSLWGPLTPQGSSWYRIPGKILQSQEAGDFPSEDSRGISASCHFPLQIQCGPRPWGLISLPFTVC